MMPKPIATIFIRVISLLLICFMTLMVYGVTLIDGASFERSLERNRDSINHMAESITSEALIGISGIDETIEDLKKIMFVKYVSIYDIEDILIYNDIENPCSTSYTNFREVYKEGNNHCITVPIKLGVRFTSNQNYENSILGYESRTVDSTVLGYVVLGLSNSAYFESTQLFIMLLIVGIVTAFFAYILKNIMLGRSLEATLDCINSSDISKLEWHVSQKNILVKEYYDIASAFIEKKKESNILKNGLLLATETEEATAREMAAIIHDDLCAKLHLVKRHLGGSSSSIEKIEEIVELIDSADSVARAVIKRSNYDAIDALGLEAGIRALVDNLSEPKVHLVYTAERTVEVEKNKHIARIISEAVLNAIKHADSSLIKVLVEDLEDRGDINFVVYDDGKGFKRGNYTNHFGLTLMEERANLIDSLLHIDSDPSGTTISFSVSALG